MNNFLKCEEKGRKIFKKILVNSPKVFSFMFTEDEYCPYDVEWKNIDDTMYVGELKYRDRYASTDKIIQDEGALLEKYKFDTIKSYYPYDKHLYIMMFSDGVGYIWDLDNIEPKWKTKRCPKTTAEESDDTVKIIATLPLSEGKRFTFSQDIYW